jgi:hypothetical protein
LTGVRSTVVLLSLIAVAVGAAGCRNADTGQVESVAARFQAALERGDGAAACRLLIGDTTAKLTKDQGQPCARAITGQHLTTAAVRRARVYETHAAAGLVDGQVVFLDHTDRGWRVSAAGCKPRGDQPYECEVES